jgi:hypothetical protein
MHSLSPPIVAVDNCKGSLKYESVVASLVSSSLFLTIATGFVPAQAQANQESTQTQAKPAAGELPAMKATNEVELEVVAALPIRPLR